MLNITITRPGRDPETVSIDKRYVIIGSNDDADLRLEDAPARAVEIRHTDDGSLVFKVLDGSMPMKLGSRDLQTGKGYRQPAPAAGKAFKMTLTVGEVQLRIVVVDSPAERAKAMLETDSVLSHEVDLKAGMSEPSGPVSEDAKLDDAKKKEEPAAAAPDERLNTWFSVPSKDEGVSGLAGLGITKDADGRFVAAEAAQGAGGGEDAVEDAEEEEATEADASASAIGSSVIHDAPADQALPDPPVDKTVDPSAAAPASGEAMFGALKKQAEDRSERETTSSEEPPAPPPPPPAPVAVPAASAPPPEPPEEAAGMAPKAEPVPAAQAQGVLMGGHGGGGGSAVPATMIDIPPQPEAKRSRAVAKPGAPMPAPAMGGAPAPSGMADIMPDATRVAGRRGLPAGTIERRTTVRYHKQMNPARNFPLLVAFSREQIAEIAREIRQEVTQSEGAQQTVVRRDNPVVTVIPRFPGCLCVPDRVDVDLTPELASVHFSISPTATGDLGAGRKSKLKELEASGKPFPSDVAYVEVQYEGRVINRVPTPTKVTTQRFARAAATMAIASPVFFGTLEAIGVEKSQVLMSGVSEAERLLGQVAQVDGLSTLWQIGIVVAGLFLILGGLFWFINRPRAGEPIDRFLTVETKPAS